MYITQKFSNRTGPFWLIVFENKDDKRKCLNELRLAGEYLSKQGKQLLYSLIRTISDRCEHNNKYQNGDEIASCVFKSDIVRIIMLMFLFASNIKEQDELYDRLQDAYNMLQDTCNILQDTCDISQNTYDKLSNMYNKLQNSYNELQDLYNCQECLIERALELVDTQAYMLDYYEHKYGKIDEDDFEEYMKHCQQ